MGAARILNPLRIIGKGNPNNAAPPPNRIPFFIQCKAWVPSEVKDPSLLTSVEHDWTSTGWTVEHILP